MKSKAHIVYRQISKLNFVNALKVLVKALKVLVYFTRYNSLVPFPQVEDRARTRNNIRAIYMPSYKLAFEH